MSLMPWSPSDLESIPPGEVWLPTTVWEHVWWDGLDVQPAQLLGWWDGAAIQPVNLLGYWDGAAIQPTTAPQPG